MDKKGKYCYDYPHPAVSADCVVFGYDGDGLKVLLIERGRDPFCGMWALPGGFINIYEDAATGAKRELLEETGLDIETLEQFHAFTAVGRDPRERVISIAHFALIPLDGRRIKGGDDARRAEWFPICEVPPLAFDHARMLRMAFDRLRERLRLYPDENVCKGIDIPPSDIRWLAELLLTDPT